MQDSIHCVVLTLFDGEFDFLKSVLRFAGMYMHRAESLEQADFLLMVTESTVLLSDVALADCSWRSVAQRLNSFHPLVPMLLIADPVDEPFVQDAYSLGVCGVLWKPIQFDAATRLIRTVAEASRERSLRRAARQTAQMGVQCPITD